MSDRTHIKAAKKELKNLEAALTLRKQNPYRPVSKASLDYLQSEYDNGHITEEQYDSAMQKIREDLRGAEAYQNTVDSLSQRISDLKNEIASYEQRVREKAGGRRRKAFFPAVLSLSSLSCVLLVISILSLVGIRNLQSTLSAQNAQIENLTQENHSLNSEVDSLNKSNSSLSRRYAQSFDEGYDAGYHAGYIEGENIGFDAGWSSRSSFSQTSGNLVKIGEATAKPYYQTANTDSSTQAYSQTVYITDTGSKYHRWGCQYLRESSNAISLNSAKSYGYSACSRCW